MVAGGRAAPPARQPGRAPRGRNERGAWSGGRVAAGPHDQLAREGPAGPERAREMVALEAGGVDRLLEVEAEAGVGQEELQGPLVLGVPARGPEGQAGLAVAQGQRGAEGGPRPGPGA